MNEGSVDQLACGLWNGQRCQDRPHFGKNLPLINLQGLLQMNALAQMRLTIVAGNSECDELQAACERAFGCLSAHF